MKKTEIILTVIVVISVILNIFLLSQYIKFKPLLNDLSKTYLIGESNS